MTAQSVVLAIVPILLFSVLYAFHIVRVARLTYVDRPDAQRLFEPGNAAAIIPRSLMVMAHWTIELALPLATTVIPSTFGRFVKSVAFSWTSPWQLVNAAVVILIVVVIGMSTSRRHLGRMAPLLVLVGGAMVAYTAVVCFGRAPSEVAGVTYYPYIFGFLVAVLSYAAIDFSLLKSWPAAGLGLALTALIALNISGAAAVARESERINHYPSLYLNRVIRFVDQHQAEPAFSFVLQPHPETLDPIIDLVEGYPGDPRSPVTRLRLTEILFRATYDARQPRYVLDAAAEKIVSSP